MIPFNIPHLTGKEAHYMYEAVYKYGQISGNGVFTKKCQAFFEDKYDFRKTLLTTSCTDALEMTAILMDIQPGDEVIVPSYTFVSTALAFVRQGAKIIFADSRPDHPGIDEGKIEALISKRTKAIVVVHYAGVACDMNLIMDLAQKYNLFIVEDAAQGIDSFYYDKPLGGIGHFGVYSFHETKNIQSGEGGLLIVNDERFVKRAEIIWEKGTNRAEFFRGEVNKYGWVDTGSSFLPSDIIAAFLFAQLEHLDDIQNRRRNIWETYYEALKPIVKNGFISLPVLPEYAFNNAHMFYLLFNEGIQRDKFIMHMKSHKINPVFHYLSLHKSEFYKKKYEGIDLPNVCRYSDCLVRLPFYYELNVHKVVEQILRYFDNVQ